MKKYQRSQTKVASNAVKGYAPSPLKANSQAVQHREKRRDYEKHWTAARSSEAHRNAFRLSR